MPDPSSLLILCESLRCRQLGLDLVPRQEFSMVDPDEISVTELYRLVSVPLCSSYLRREQQGSLSSIGSCAVSLRNRISGRRLWRGGCSLLLIQRVLRAVSNQTSVRELTLPHQTVEG